MPTAIATAVAWMRRRAENIVAGLLGLMFVAFIIQIVFRYFFNFPVGWTSELSVVTWLYMVLIGSAFWLKETEEVRFDLISARLGPKGRRAIGLVVAIVRRRPVRHGAAGHREVRRLHEGREQLLPQDPSRPAVLDLHRVRRRDHRPLSLGDREPDCAARRRKRPTSPRRRPDYEPHQPVCACALRHRRVEPDRTARRLRDDRRLNSVAVPVGPRHGDRSRAVAERDDGEPAAAGDPAVHPRRRVHEHRQHHGPAAALLQRDRRPLSRRPGAGQRRAEHHLRQHVGLRARRCRGLGQDHAVDDDHATASIRPHLPRR